MIKLSLEEVADALKQAKVPEAQNAEVLSKLKNLAEEKAEEKADATVPKAKNEFGVIVFDKDKVITGDFTAAVYQIAEGGDHGLVLGKISQAARDQNLAAKRKKHKFESLGDALHAKRAFLKQQGVLIKTKIPVRVLLSDNTLV